MTRKEEIQEKSENELGTIDYQVGFSQGAQWADKTMIDKACEWLDSIMCQLSPEDPILVCNYTDFDELINDFKKAMEE